MTSDATSTAPEASAATSTFRSVAVGVLWAVTLVGWAPVLSVLAAGVVATLFGCTLNEARVHPCVVAGIDFGGLLSSMAVLGWLMIVTAPLMLVTFVIWAVLGVAFIMRRARAKRVSA